MFSSLMCSRDWPPMGMPSELVPGPLHGRRDHGVERQQGLGDAPIMRPPSAWRRMPVAERQAFPLQVIIAASGIAQVSVQERYMRQIDAALDRLGPVALLHPLDGGGAVGCQVRPFELDSSGMASLGPI